MSDKATPAERYNEYTKRIQDLGKQRRAAEEKLRKINSEIDQVYSLMAAMVKLSIGFAEGDVVVDDQGVKYRVTRFDVRLQSYRREVPDTITEARKRTRVYGIALTKTGLPRWTDDRLVHGKLKRVDDAEA